MRGLVRWVFLLLLVVCVPLKALAATAGWVCLHGHDTEAVQTATHGAAEHEHCDGHGAPAADQAAGDGADATHACGACAPCCAASAPAPEAADAGVAALPPHFDAQSVLMASGIVTDVPHQPPR